MRTRLLFLLLCSGTAISAIAGQAPTFSVVREVVRVDVLVSEGGRLATGLTADDFELRDNGVLQTVELVRRESIPLNVVLAFDLSRSIAGEKLRHLKQAGQALLNALGSTDQAALVTFNHAVTLNQALTADISLIHAALARLQGRGETALVDGLYASILVGESDVGRSIVIVFSDGMDTASWLPKPGLLETVRRSDVVVYGVTTEQSRDAPFLRDIGKATGGRLFPIASSAELEAAFVAIFDEFRSRYLLTYTPEGVGQDGWHALDVRVRRRGATVAAARPGYFK